MGGLAPLERAVQRYLVDNDKNKLEAISETLLQCSLFPAASKDSSAFTSNSHLGNNGSSQEMAISELQLWQQDCTGMFTLVYAAFSGQTVSQEMLNYHLMLFMGKSPQKVEGGMKYCSMSEGALQLLRPQQACHGFRAENDLWNVALTLRSDLRTECFAALALLYCHVITCQYGVSTSDIEAFLNFIQDQDCSNLIQTPSPLWLQQVTGTTDAFAKIVKSLKALMYFMHNISLPQCKGNCKDLPELELVLHMVLQYKVLLNERVCSTHEAVTTCCSGLESSVVSSAFYRGIHNWLKGLAAANRGSTTLACSLFGAAVETSEICAGALYNAAVAFRRLGKRAASLECFRLFFRASQERVPPTTPCLSYSTALLEPLLPSPCRLQATAAASLALSCVNNKFWKEACGYFTLLFEMPVSLTSTRPCLLETCHMPPQCIARPVLLGQALLAATRLGDLPTLEDINKKISTVEDNFGSASYYSCAATTQLEVVSDLFCAVLRAWAREQHGERMVALRDCARLVENTMWVSSYNPSPSSTHTLLLVAPLLLQYVLYTFLHRLHSALSNAVNARHFQRLARQAALTVEEALGKFRDMQQGMEVRGTLRVTEDGESCVGKVDVERANIVNENVKYEKNVSTNMEEAKGAAVLMSRDLLSLIAGVCETVEEVEGLNDVEVVALTNICMYLGEEVANGR